MSNRLGESGERSHRGEQRSSERPTAGDHAETAAFDPSAIGSQAEGSLANRATSAGSASEPRSSASAPVVREPAPGQMFGRYQIRQLLGRGGMGSVYLAHDAQLDRPVAIKIPRLEGDATGKLVTRFLREARAVAHLSHANICPVFDVGEQDGIHFLAMAFIKGKPLAQFAEPGKLQPERGIALTIYKVALALEEAHSKGILHRDLKPANILVDHRGEPMVMDFGLSHRLNDEAQSRLTQEGTVIGTPAYMAPEQIDGKQPIGPATDVYSLGVVLYELLTGRCPYEGSMVSVIGQVLHSEPPSISELRPDVSPPLIAICEKAMAKDPRQRYATMKEFAAALAAYLKGRTTVSAARPADGDARTVQMPVRATAPAAGSLAALESATGLEALLTSSEAATMTGGNTNPLLAMPTARQKHSIQPLWFVIPAGLGVAVLAIVFAGMFRGNDEKQVAALEKPDAPSASEPPSAPPAAKVDVAARPAERPQPPSLVAPPQIVETPTVPQVNRSAESTVPDASSDGAVQEIDTRQLQPNAKPESEAEDPMPQEPATPPPAAEKPSKPGTQPNSQEPGFSFPEGEHPPESPGEGPRPALPGVSIAEKFQLADRNRDGKLDAGEAPMHVILRADKNGDRMLSQAEAEQAFKRLKERLFAEPSAAEMKRLPKPPRFRPGGPIPRR